MDDPFNQPAASPPPGQTSNLVDPPSQAYVVVITVVICLVAVTPGVFIRLFVSGYVIRRFRWDDTVLLLCWLGFIAYSINMIETTVYGSMVDMWNIRLGQFVNWAKLAHVEELIYPILLFSVKLTVLMLYKRIFIPSRTKKTWVNYAIILVIVYNALMYSANILIFAFSCTPRAKIFNPLVPGRCIDMVPIMLATGSLNMVSDLFMVLIPTIVIWQLRLPRKRKLEILFVFGFSLVCFLSSVAGMVYSGILATSANSTVTVVQIALWTFAEIAACFLASCVPMVPLFVRTVCGWRKRRGSARATSADVSASFRAVAELEAKEPSVRRSRMGPMRKGWTSEDDLYLIYDDEPPHLDRENSTSSDGSNINNIIVSRTVDITSVPRAHVEMSTQSRSLDYHNMMYPTTPAHNPDRTRPHIFDPPSPKR